MAQMKDRKSQARGEDGSSTAQPAQPQHLSGDDPTLDGVDSASADSFPASDPPATSSPTKSVLAADPKLAKKRD